MRAVIQRVNKAEVTVGMKVIGCIDHGLLVFIGIEAADDEEDIKWLSNKIVQLRIFNDQDGVMNLSLKDTGGDVLLVSQFTLHASTRKGNRPSYLRAAKPEIALPMYHKMVAQLQEDLGKLVSTGEFQADMKVSLINDGPVTILIDSKDKQ